MRQVTADEAAALLRDGDTLADRRLRRRPCRAGRAAGRARAALLAETAPRGTSPPSIRSGSATARGSAPAISRTKGLLKRVVVRHLRQFAGDLRPGDRRQDRGLHAAAGRAVAAHARDGRRPPRPAHEDRPAHLRRSAPSAAGGRANRAKEDLVELVQFRGEDYLFFKPYHVDVCFCAAPRGRGRQRDDGGGGRLAARCCRWRRRRGAAAASSSCRSSAWPGAAPCRPSRSRSPASWSTSSWSTRTSARPTRPITARPMPAS